MKRTLKCHLKEIVHFSYTSSPVAGLVLMTLKRSEVAVFHKMSSVTAEQLRQPTKRCRNHVTKAKFCFLEIMFTRSCFGDA